MDIIKKKKAQQARRQRRVRAKISGTTACPRLSVFRSTHGLFLQLIDDTKGRTLLSAASQELKSVVKNKGASNESTKVRAARELGELLAKKAKDKKIVKVVFDRGAYKYHGRVKAVAEGARAGGLKF